jgi:hypothetical protein
MRSIQETLLKDFAERSLAAPFVFVPRKQRNGDEPADLVWACNNCVILMYMTEHKVYADKQKRTRVLQKSIQHNLRQAQGWLRAWRQGHYLSGDNGFYNFSLKYDSSYRVVILSVIKCGDAVAELHDEDAKRLAVSCCVTLPQSCVQQLAQNGLTSLDLVHLINLMRLQHGTGPVSEGCFHDILTTYCRASAVSAGVQRFWPTFELDDRFHEVVGPITGTRRRRATQDQSVKSASTIDALKDVLNDITVLELFTVAVQLREGMDRVLNRPKEEFPGVIHMWGQFRDYGYCLCVAPTLKGETELAGASRAYVAGVLQEWAGTEERRHLRQGFMIIADCEAKGFYLFVYPKAGLSRTELLLDRMAPR